VVEILLSALLILVVLATVIWPLIVPDSATSGGSAAGRGSAITDSAQDDIDDIDAAKEAKYREIRDAELDFRAGKFSEQEWKVIDAQLRAEAIALLGREQSPIG